MEYKEVINFLFSQLPMYQRDGKAAYKANLDNTIALDKHFNHPHKNFKSIHIAGTNGKGSVSHILASVLQEQGYKVGLYTSPHLKDFRERIKINGEMISEKAVVDFVKNNKEIIKELTPSFFEITVAMAFDYFSNEKIDYAVIEVGMGGRLDSTNIISPELSIITNIGFDHTQFLGDTLEKIAIEKAGIIKENTSVIIGETQVETKEIFLIKAGEKNSSIYFADEYFNIEYALIDKDNKQVFNVRNYKNQIVYEKLKIDLLGLYQKKNTITALKALEILSEKYIAISLSSIYKGFENVVSNTGLMGRWQCLGNNPLIICDTAHNKEGLSYVLSQLKNIAYKELHIVLGTVDDKNVDEILKLFPKDASYYFTRASIPRALDQNILFEKAKNAGLQGHVFNTVKSAYTSAKKNAGSNDMIFIGGSTFIVAEVV